MINKIQNLIYKFLRKSQKYTGTDNIYIAKQGSYLTIGNIISAITAFLLSIAFARLLPKETYGEYRYILSIFGLLTIASLRGINSATIRAVAIGYENTVNQAFKTKIKWSLLGSIASVGVAIYFWLQGNADFTISFLIVAAFLPLFKSGEIYQSYLTGKKLFGKRVTYNSLSQILSTVVLVAVLFITKNLIVLILAYFLSYSVLRIFFFLWTINKIRPNKKNDPKAISYGKHLSIMGFISFVSEQIDKVLLFHFVGPIQLAIYSFAILPIQHLQDPLQSIQELALPKLSVRPEKEIKNTLPKKVLKISVLIILGIGVYIFIAPYFYQLLYPQYMDSVFYSRLFSFTLLVFPASMMTLSLHAKMKTKALYKINIISPIIKIVLFVIFIPLYGILGVIIAMLISQIFHFLIVYSLFRKM